MAKHMGLYRERGVYKGVHYDIHAKTKKDLREKIQTKFAEIDTGVVDSSMTVSTWIKRWFNTYAVPRLSPKELANKQSMIDTHILPAIGTMQLRNVRSVHLQAMLNELSCSEAYGRKIMQLTNQIFRAACQNKLLADNPADSIVLPKLAKEKRRRAITAKERELLTAAALQHRGGCWVMLQLLCGLRPSEAAAVQKIDLMNGNILHVTKAVDRYTGEIKSTKTESGVRDVPIPETMWDFLNQWEWWDKLKPFDYIITTLRGDIVRDGGQRSVWNSLKRIMDMNNGATLYRNAIVESTLADDFTPYCLRHTYCTDLQAAGVPINVAKELMGHSDISVTSRIYTHSSAEALHDAALCINALAARRKGSSEAMGSKTGSDG